jgi:hypothetical protein
LALCINENEHLDVLFYSGRAFEALNDNEIVISQLKKYIQVYSNTKNSTRKHQKSMEYIIMLEGSVDML